MKTPDPVDVDALKARHVLLKEFRYELRPVVRGYNMRTLYVNVSSNEIKEKAVSEEMKQKFTGGKGFGLKLLWDAISDTTRWNDPENEINIAMGPICGNTNYPGSGKSLVVSISPLTDIPIDSNVGGYFGPYLKFSGFDAIEIQGKAERDVIVYVDGNQGLVRIFEAPGEAVDSHILAEQMVELFAANELEKMHISTVSAGRGAEHALIGCLNFSFYDRRRKVSRLKQAGRGGIGTVLRDKKIKAVVVKYSGLSGKSNNPVDLDKLQQTGLKLHKEIIALDDQQCRMRQIGTAHLVEIMDEYDLLPTHNFKFGRHVKTPKINSHAFYDLITHGLPDGCWYGCTLAAPRPPTASGCAPAPTRGSASRWTVPSTRRWAAAAPTSASSTPAPSSNQFLLRHLRAGHHLLRHHDRVHHASAGKSAC